MDKQYDENFEDLLDKWMESPEYQAYEELCFSSDTLLKQVKHGEEIIELFNKAINNEYGRQLANDTRFLKLISGEDYV